MASVSGSDTAIWVSKHETISNALRHLLDRETHPHFIGYLYLHKLAFRANSTTDIEPNWAGLGEYLRVNGGPTPYLRPFWSQRRGAEQEWLNSNIAGSFAPSSLRSDGPFCRVVAPNSSGNFSLRNGHETLALKHLLLGERIDVVYLSLFLHRNHGYVTAKKPGYDDVVSCFCDDFGYPTFQATEFRELFVVQDHYDDADWFTEWQDSD